MTSSDCTDPIRLKQMDSVKKDPGFEMTVRFFLLTIVVFFHYLTQLTVLPARDT